MPESSQRDVAVELRRDEPRELVEEARLVLGGGLRVSPPADPRRVRRHTRFPCHAGDGALADGWRTPPSAASLSEMWIIG